jgi:hypothetical protein
LQEINMTHTMRATVVAMALAGLSATLHASNDWSVNEEPQSCGPKMVRGRYGFTVTGTQFFAPPTPPVQAVTVGQIVFDGHGGLSGSDVVSLSGQIVPRTLTGNYVVRRDCTIEARVDFLTGTPGFKFTFRAVIVDQGREILAIQTDPGALFIGTLKK